MKVLILLALIASFYITAAQPTGFESCEAQTLVFNNLARYYQKAREEPIERENCLLCVAELAGTIAGCIAGGWTGAGIVGCVSAAIGTGNTCYDCICYAIEELTPWTC